MGDYRTFGMQPGLPLRQQISNITDTRFFPQLTQCYGGDILIINLLRLKPGELDHLSLEDVKIIVREIRSKVAILTPLGMTVLGARSSGGKCHRRQRWNDLRSRFNLTRGIREIFKDKLRSRHIEKSQKVCTEDPILIERTQSRLCFSA